MRWGQACARAVLEGLGGGVGGRPIVTTISSPGGWGLHRASEPVWRWIQRLITSDTKPTKVCVISMSDKLWFAFRPL